MKNEPKAFDGPFGKFLSDRMRLVVFLLGFVFFGSLCELAASPHEKTDWLRYGITLVEGICWLVVLLEYIGQKGR